MQQQYYSLPINATAFIENKVVEKCDIKESIANHLHLLMTSCFGECHFDREFGCAIWNVDFNNVGNDNKLVMIVKDSLYTALKKYEQRLHKINISVQIQQEERANGSKVSRIKKRVTILVNATIKKTNENFSFNESFFIGPLSY